MQSPLLSDFLLLMEQPLNVLFCILLMIGIRVAWVSYRKANPLPEAALATTAAKRHAARNGGTPVASRPKEWVSRPSTCC